MAGETPVRSDDHLISPDNAALVLIDYQPEQVRTVRSTSLALMMLNTTAVARAAAAFGLPVVLSTVGVEMGVNTDAHDRAMQRMVHAGAQPVTAISLTSELQRDWGRPGADRLRSILRWYFPELEKIS